MCIFLPVLFLVPARDQGAAEGIAPDLWSWKSAGKALGDVLGWIPGLQQGDFM